MKERTVPNIAVVCGGTSPEREVSLETGKNVFRALQRLGYETRIYDLDEVFYRDALDRAFDGVFIALHGSPGEDGTVQGFLDLVGVPYTGSGVLASSIALDKRISKAVFKDAGLSVARYTHGCRTREHGEPLEVAAAEAFGYPLVVKPSRLGSSVGVTIVRSRRELVEAIEHAHTLDCCVIVEEFIEGREIQCGIVGRDELRALPLIEIVSKKEFFDYEAKYTPGMAEEITPAPLDPQTTARGQEVALKAFRAVECRDVARVDMFLTSGGEFIVSEVNTIPGLTSNSLLPKEARAAGMEYDELISMIVAPMVEEIRKRAPR